MAVIIGNPGEGALLRGLLNRVLAVIFITLFAGILVAGVAWMLGGSRAWWVVAVSVLVVIAEIVYYRKTLVEVLELYGEGGNWLKGAEGERRVSAELGKLPDEFIVFNDFHPVKDGTRAAWNIDHIVIGPSGVFVIETKHYSNARVPSAAESGITRRNVKQANANALELKNRAVRWSGGQLQGLFVVPVLVYAQDGASVTNLWEGHVRVLPLRLLVKTILGHREAAIDHDRASRLALVLFDQMDVGTRTPFKDDIVRFGRVVRTVPRTAVPPAAPAPAAVQAPQACPKCGSSLVVRTARKGAHAGESFLACPGYPECKHTAPLPS